jgi:predicted phage baseplate assembly protein
MSPHEHADTCGCCEGVESLTPQTIWNRPGLDALAYRVGTHATFKESMIAALARSRRSRALTTRSDDDPSIAIIDSWAAALDVLTFYQERIANEGYLRTATETRSVAELARAIGYRFGPGVAASTLLAFEMATTPGAPESVQLEPGVKVQSTPRQDESPQMFETVESIEARPEWNAMPARTTVAYFPGVDATTLHLRGITNDVKAGDMLLVVGRGRESNKYSEDWDIHPVLTVTLDAGRDLTTLSCGAGTRDDTGPAPQGVSVYVLRQRASIFGYNAPDWRGLPLIVKRGYLTDDDAAVAAIDAALKAGKFGTTHDAVPPDWTFHALVPGTTDTIDLDAVYPKIVAGGWCVLAVPEGTLKKVVSSRGKKILLFKGTAKRVELYGIVAATDASRTDYTLSSKTTRLKLSGEQLKLFDDAVRTTAVFAQSERLELGPAPVVDPVQGEDVVLAARVDGLTAGRTVIVTGKRPRVTVAPGATGVTLEPATGAAIALAPGESLTVLAPFTESATTRTWTVSRADDTAGTVTASKDEVTVTSALEDDPEIAEQAVIEESSLLATGETSLRFVAPLTGSYDRLSARVHANVARATHGETTREVLGGGDGGRAFQRFALKRAPMTHVPAANPSGAETTLEVRVDDVAWEPRDSFLDAGPSDRAYVATALPDEPAEIAFGDGVTGARLPTRTANVVATYRAGIGVAGNLEPGQLDVLMSRPLGLSGVRNPLPAAGGADPDALEDIRINAPKTVKAFERVVSLADFEDFALAFAGVAKARADWVWSGRRRVVHLTVAGVGGFALAPETFVNLRNAIAKERGGRAPFAIASFEPVYFEIEAGVYVSAEHEWATVKPAIETALRETFAFDARSFARGVSESEVVAAIQRVAGVVGVDLDHLRPAGGAAVEAVVVAEPARLDGSVLRPAQLVLLGTDPAAIVLTERES